MSERSFINFNNSVASDLAYSVRQQIIIGNIFQAYNYVKIGSKERGIISFLITIKGMPSDFAIENSLSPHYIEWSSFQPYNSTKYLAYWDKSSNIRFLKIPIYFDADEKELLAELVFGFDAKPLQKQMRAIAIGFLLLSISVVILIAMISSKIYLKATKNIQRNLEYFSKLAKGEKIVPPRNIDEFGPFKDLTEKLSREVLELQKRERETAAEHAIGKMTAQIAHDIRGPLATLTMFIRSIDQLRDEDKKIFQESARNCLDRIQCMANELVDFTKSSRLEQKPIVLKDFIEKGIFPLIAQQAQNKGISLNYIEPKELVAKLDVSKMERVLVNLVLNSIQAIHSEGGKIFIESSIVNKVCLCLKVVDNGPGISTENLENMFKRFFTTKKGGTGLGLAYSKQVIEAHGGKIEVDSSKNGTTFKMSFPDGVLLSN